MKGAQTREEVIEEVSDWIFVSLKGKAKHPIGLNGKPNISRLVKTDLPSHISQLGGTLNGSREHFTS